MSDDTAPTGADDRGDADAAVVDLLLRTYPPELVDAAIAACGRTERRRRLLPARRMVYFVLAMAAFSPAPYLDVMRRLETGLRRAGLSQPGPSAGKAAIFQARERLGSGPMEVLFRDSALRRCDGTQLLPHRSAPPHRRTAPHWRGRALHLLAEQRTAAARHTSAMPRLAVTGLLDGGTGEVVDAAWDAPGAPATLLRSVGPDTLLVVEGLTPDHALAAAAAARGTGIAWRLPIVRLPLQPERRLVDGSFLVRPRGVPLRVIGTGLVTNLLDPAEAPADELLDAADAVPDGRLLGDAVLSAGPDAAPLTSRTAEGIDQELYGRLLVHNARRIAGEMTECAYGPRSESQ
ncbi:transposase domain-containing protein [Kitasatospora sp. DSM 101779]|uniref:transposase domain-containing protein n=1 Tax=Kitasatospora sp. DSM 101779 TaxID=2853165 RepID=UPI0021D7EAF7|nr:transposase domain-containing protein [Kitasatospora sp. DSM 101779]MCU7822101.1 transposase domain-containing protein [Kitasatospora sp. DSM 101779]